MRAYAWKTILGSDGVLNTLLQYVRDAASGRVPAVQPFCRGVNAYSHLYAVHLPAHLCIDSNTSRDILWKPRRILARVRRTFWTVIFPLSLPGALAGATFAFVLSLGDFLAPLLIGGPSGIMISNVVVSLFGAAYNWPLGAAISASLLLLVLALLWLTERLQHRLTFR